MAAIPAADLETTLDGSAPTVPVEVDDAPAADGSIKGDEEKETALAVKQIQDRIGMRPKTALCRSLGIHFVSAAAFGVFLLVTVQFWTKYGFDGDYIKAGWFLAGRSTMANWIRVYTTPLFGHLCDRTTRKGWMVMSLIGPATCMLIWAVLASAGNESALVIGGWISVFPDLFSPVWVGALSGMAKDVMPEHTYNDATKYHACHSKFMFTKLGFDTLVQLSGSLGFFLGNIIAIVLLVLSVPEIVHMFIAGALYIFAALLVLPLLPESIDPDYKKGNIMEYIRSKECREKDLNPLKNLRILVSTKALASLFLAWWFEVAMTSNASVVVMYATYRWGLGATWLVVLFIVGFLCLIPSMLSAHAINSCVGEVKSATARNLLVYLYQVMYMFNTRGVIYYVPYAALAGLLYFGQVTLYSWAPRLVDYHQQAEEATTRAAIYSFATGIFRFVYIALFEIGAKKSELIDYGGRSVVKDCAPTEEDRQAHWCSAPAPNTAAEIDEFTHYGPAEGPCAGKGSTCNVPQTQAVWQLKDGMTATAGSAVVAGSACDINSGKDPFGEHKCFCLWKTIRCKEPPAADASVGGIFDPLVTPFMCSAVIAIIAFFWWMVIIFVMRPISEMKKRNEKEVDQWREKTFKDKEVDAKTT